MKVCIFRVDDSACDYYRTVLPVNTATIYGHFQKSELWISNLLATIKFDEQKFLDGMNSDIYFLQRVSNEVIINKLREFSKNCGINAKIVLDQDDDIFNTSPFSTHYSENGTEELKIVHEGKLIHEWKDGVNINIKENQKRMDGIRRALASVDMVTTTNEHLAKTFREYNDNVKVLPNCVDLREWKRLSINRSNPNEIRLGWQGGNSHWEDLYLVRNSLKRICEKYPNVKIVMVGYLPASMEKDFRPEQFEFHPWRPTAAHPYRMASLDIDIAIIPLKDTIFNRAKSHIKWVEFSALEIPTVTSYVPPYDEIQESDDLNKGIFVQNNDTEAWIKGLEILINDHQVRKLIVKNALNFVKENFDINTQYKQWVNTFEELKNGVAVES